MSRTLGLEPVPGRRAVRAAALPAVACLLLGIAIAQPAFTTTTGRAARTSSEVVFVADVSRSMTASSGPGKPTRLERARSIVAQLRASVPDVPSGLSGLTDRVLPYAFPTLDEQTFSETLARSVQVESPPPQAVSDVATSFEPLSALTRDGFYRPGTEHRTCVLVTDGETRADSSWNGGCRLLVVRVGTAKDRIYAASGKVDAGYRPETTAADTVGRLARAAGSVAYSEGDVGAAAAALRRLADAGPSHTVGTAQSVQPSRRSSPRSPSSPLGSTWCGADPVDGVTVAEPVVVEVEGLPALGDRAARVLGDRDRPLEDIVVDLHILVVFEGELDGEVHLDRVVVDPASFSLGRPLMP